MEAVEPEVVEDDLLDLTEVPLLNERELKFASAVASGDKFNVAWKEAFPDKAATYAKTSVYILASKLAQNPRVRQQIEVIQQAARLHFVLDAPRAAQKMTTLSECASSEKIQFEATKDILNRGGLQPPQRIETLHIGVFGSASQEDIRDLLRKRLEQEKEEDKEDE